MKVRRKGTLNLGGEETVVRRDRNFRYEAGKNNKLKLWLGGEETDICKLRKGDGGN